MRVLIFEKAGLENLQIAEIDKPQIGSEDVLIRVKMAGVNPIDYRVSLGIATASPMPHIPGSEVAGTVEEIGTGVTGFRTGDRVIVYNRLFDGICDMCLSNSEMLCRNGGIFGVISNGGYSEYVAVKAKNVLNVPDDVSWEMAASLPVAALTPYHALSRAGLRKGETFVVFGASGSTGLFAVQLGKKLGARVLAVSSKSWVKDYGADEVIGREEVGERLKVLTSGKMADVVMDSIGEKAWSLGLASLGLNGRLVFFGSLTGGNGQLPLGDVYGKQWTIIGSTGGAKAELAETIRMAKDLRLKMWRKYSLEEGAEALNSLVSKDRDGRILIEFDH